MAAFPVWLNLRSVCTFGASRAVKSDPLSLSATPVGTSFACVERAWQQKTEFHLGASDFRVFTLMLHSI